VLVPWRSETLVSGRQHFNTVAVRGPGMFVGAVGSDDGGVRQMLLSLLSNPNLTNRKPAPRSLAPLGMTEHWARSG
jgi:hypothetical protein